MTQTVTTPGSNLVFVNTYGTGVTQSYINCILAAEDFYEKNLTCTTTFTLNLQFNAAAEGQNGELASNSWSSWVPVTYAQLKNALTQHAGYDSYMAAAAASLPASDPNPAGGAGWYLPESYARMLGLSTYAPTIDDTITLNTSYSWTWGQDVINALEHEISEGAMGRVGGLGDQNGVWSTMDLFRYSAPGVHDYTDGRDGKTTYFSYNGTTLSTIPFDNDQGSNASGGDVADYNAFDVFGYEAPGATNTFSLTDFENMDVLGWEPQNPNGAAAVSDFNGDGRSDILWRNILTGVVTENEMSGSQVIATATAGGDLTWNVVGVGDFNGDGKSDILWENTTGQVAEYQMNGTQILSSAWIGGALGWSIVGTGDFNGDGKSDILWENDLTGQVAEYQMNGAQVVSTAWVGGALGWSVVGVGDFNGDGKSDILWENNVTGQVAEYQMNGAQVVSTAWVGGALGWSVVGVGDFNGDGKSDILWENNATGQVAEYLMNGSQILSTAWVSGNLNNSVVGVGDFNGDGKSDILWQNHTTGQVTMNLMNGSQVLSSTVLGGSLTSSIA